jgi:hypothetical protein
LTTHRDHLLTGADGQVGVHSLHLDSPPPHFLCS